MLALFVLMGFVPSLAAPTQASKPSWQDAYANFLRETRMSEYNMFKSYAPKYEPDFYFFLRDIDNNGIPELIARWDQSAAGHPVEVFTYSNGVQHLGSYAVPGSVHGTGISDNPKFPGLFTGLGNYRYHIDLYITIKNNKLVEETISIGQTESIDEEQVITIHNTALAAELTRLIPAYDITEENIIKAIYNYEGPPINVNPTSSSVLVNGKLIAFDAYTINGNNYFKLRDLAKVVDGTSKSFEVKWDSSRNTINLISNTSYTSAGGELEKGDGKPKIASQTKSTIYKDGTELSFTAYTIKGNNYFKLRDLAEAFDIEVTWDKKTNTIGIDTSKGYIAE